MKAGIFLRRAALLSLAGVLLALTGCNTVAGFGQDISSSARTVQHAL
jgi:predicted small secreted protein